MDIEFFDCQMFYGYDMHKSYSKGPLTYEDITSELMRFGIKKALVQRIEGLQTGAVLGNRLLLEDMSSSSYEGIYGVLSILPTLTGEFKLKDMPKLMREKNIRAFGLHPEVDNYHLARYSLKDVFIFCSDREIPVFATTEEGGSLSLNDLVALLEEFPKLKIIHTLENVWPVDRYIRPLYENFSNYYYNLAWQQTSGFFEDFVPKFGAEKLIFGSAYPFRYPGGLMMMLKHADISIEDKRLIANGNLSRIIDEVDFND